MAGAPAPLPHLGLVLGPSYTLTAEQGSYSVTGQAATLSYGYTLSAGQGAYTYSGQTASLVLGLRLDAAQGSYAVSGQSAELIVPGTPAPFPHLGLLFGLGNSSTILTAAQGSYTVTGQAAAFLRGYAVTAEHGVYNLSGQVAALEVSGARSGDPAPFPHIGLLLAPGSGGYTLTADTGIYTITGSEALADFEVTAEQGSYTVTGQAANLVRTYIFTCDSGTYNLSGQDATFSIGSPSRTMPADQGAYTVTGYDAGLRHDYKITAEQGFYSLAGQAATLSVGSINNYTIAADSGTYTLSGQAATLTRSDPVLQAESGSYVVYGQDVRFDVPRRLTIRARGRNYVIRGRRYLNVTNEELAYLLAREMIDVRREDVKVSFKDKKDHPVSKAAWDSLQETIRRIEALPFEDADDEAAAMLLL